MSRGDPPPPSPAGQQSALGELPDGMLVSRALGGEPAAFGVLYDRHADRVYRFLRFRVQDEAQAIDFTQDVFVNALRHLHSLREQDRFASWLMQIAHNHVLNHWAHSTRRAEPLSLDLPLDRDADGPALDIALVDATDVADTVAMSIETARVVAAAQSLTDDQQAVLGLRFAAELSVLETAQVLGKGEEAVKQLQHRAVARLRRLLRPDEATS